MVCTQTSRRARGSASRTRGEGEGGNKTLENPLRVGPGDRNVTSRLVRDLVKGTGGEIDVTDTCA